MSETPPKYVVAALYKFTPLADFESYKAPLTDVCEAAGVTGTLLLAHEGINGTIAGLREGVDKVLSFIRNTVSGCADLDVKESYSDVAPFIRLKVRLKREIVTMGVPDIDPRHSVGQYVAPEDWNALISDPDTIVVDTRNDYEVAIGTFERAVNPNTASFRELPNWADENLPKDKSKKIAMFCTGGIRCEKSTALLRQRGYSEVYHLKGGILKYLEDVPKDESLWNGECFVFDRRVSVGSGLKPGPYQQCAICREPFISGEGAGGYAKKACPKCEAFADDDQRARAKQRQHQIELARARGEEHLGPRQPKHGKHKP
ncbi:MAG: rhodanese-related sulfurtransferase [Hyphomicrobiaceae bacterium]